MGYENLSSAFVYKQPLFATKLDQLGENDKFLKDNGWQDGTKMLFYQASVPTGWTQDVTQNNKFLRVVSGIGGGSGGSHDPTTTFPTSHSHTVPTEAAHQHNLQNHTHEFATVTTNDVRVDDLASEAVRVGNQIAYVTRFMAAGTIYPNPFQKSFTNPPGSVDSDSKDAHNHSGMDSQSPGNVILQYTDIIIGTKDTSSGYTDVTSEFDHSDKTNFDPFTDLENNDNFLEDRIMPFGSVSVFYQGVAPTGWTRTTPVNDHLLRVVSGSGLGTGGSYSPASGVNFSHTHTTVVSQPAHTHEIPAHTHDFETLGTTTSRIDTPPRKALISGGRIYASDGSAVSGTVMKGRMEGGPWTSGPTSNNDHDHGTGGSLSSIQVAYLDILTASKNSFGASFPYQDLSASILYKKLVSKQRLNNLGKNDEYLNFHTMDTGNKALFYQATAPLTWTQDVSQNDKGLRVVSTGGGVTAGTQGIGSSWSLGHSHSINNDFHFHGASHAHTIGQTTDANAGNIVTGPKGNAIFRVKGGGGAQQNNIVYMSPTLMLGGPAQKQELTLNSNAPNYTLTGRNHNHGGTTGFSDPSFTLAYTDVILCTKN